MSRLLLLLSFVTFLTAIHADAANAKCDFLAVIDVANQYYRGCRDLYNVLEQSMPVNYTSQLCSDSDCMDAIRTLRSMDLGDCIVFGSTTLTSDILDQCEEHDTFAEVMMVVVLVVVVMAFVPVVIYRYLYWRQKKAATQLDLANGKLGINDGPYKEINLGARV
ncbi:hypothetical protein PHYBOEH_002475 [Phytophthora boehmeriae]|uniref:Elicitin-like protein n=1 Tax=Phytophthora boehmeriae TaxID=109152 RepID=A0A8T1WXQ7_9STRA|nr:hypothetical protein PHYBOEH_002475 [Phytophthora boehmeriae]